MPWIEIVDFTLAHKNGRAGSLPFLLYANQAAPVSASPHSKARVVIVKASVR